MIYCNSPMFWSVSHICVFMRKQKLRFHSGEFSLWLINQSTGTQALNSAGQYLKEAASWPSDPVCQQLLWSSQSILLQSGPSPAQQQQKKRSHPAHEDLRQQQGSPICNTELIAGCSNNGDWMVAEWQTISPTLCNLIQQSETSFSHRPSVYLHQHVFKWPTVAAANHIKVV